MFIYFIIVTIAAFIMALLLTEIYTKYIRKTDNKWGIRIVLLVVLWLPAYYMGLILYGHLFGFV